MMKIASILLIFLLLLGVNSCCTEMYCLGVEDINIKLQDFSLAELESVTLVNANNNYILNTYIDIQDENGFFLRLNEAFYIGNNYILSIDSGNLSYTLSDFKTSKEKCNTGFMCRDYIEHLESYKVNGVAYSANNRDLIVVNR